MKKIIVISLISFLSGCSASAFDDGRKDVQCYANYTPKTFGDPKKTIEIDKIKVDRVGQKWVHVKPNFNLKFYSYWQKDYIFTNYKCLD